MAYIYSFINRENGKVYIGSKTSKNCNINTFMTTYWSSSRNPEFWADKEAGKLEGNIIFEMDDAAECIKLENMMIKAYWEQYGKENSYNLQYTIGKNKQFSPFGCKPSFLGKHHTVESIQKRNLSMRKYFDDPAYIKKLSESHKGFKVTDETKSKISKNNGAKQKYRWCTPNGDIRIMNKTNKTKYHPDWVLIDKYE